MDPAILLMLRVEREGEAQRRLYMAYRDDLANEKSVCLPNITFVQPQGIAYLKPWKNSDFSLMDANKRK